MTTLVPLPRAAVSATADTFALAQLLAAAFLAQYSGRTRDAYAADLRIFGEFCTRRHVPILEASRAHLQLFAAELQELGRAPATVGRKLSVIAGYYGYCVAEDAITRSPAAHIRRPKVPDESPRFGLDRDELTRLLAAAGNAGPVEDALICLLALNGLRVSEACTATVEDLEHDRGHQLLTVTRKGGKRQRVPLAARTAAAIAALASRQAADVSAPLGGAGRHPLLGINRHQAWRTVRRLVDAAGITKPISPHSLRHTFVTLSLDAGAELRDVQDAAGHADPRTTRRYDRGRHNLDRHATYRLTQFLDEHPRDNSESNT